MDAGRTTRTNDEMIKGKEMLKRREVRKRGRGKSSLRNGQSSGIWLAK
jgi:hypothetical protein